MVFLGEETIFQQQERTLWSIEGSLSTIAVVLIILLLLALIVGLSMELKLGRANRIARASHDLFKAMAAEQQKGNELLEKIAARTGRIAPTEENVQRPTPNAQSRMPDTPEPDVYRID